MPAAVYVGEGRLEVQELPVPRPGPGEVLVEVDRCGICGTDLHLVLERYARPGSVLGHEWSATVVEGGAGEDGTAWVEGDRVVSEPTGGCGRCRACRRGRPSVCRERPPADLLSFRGAFCRYLSVPAERLRRIPEGLDSRPAALAEPTAIALHAVGLSGAAPGDRVLVTGGGPVGLLTTAVLAAGGVTDVTVTEPAPARRRRASEVGAARTLAPDELARAPLGQPVAEPFDLAFECSGRATAAESALDQLDRAGELILLGTGHELPRLNHNRAIVLELSVHGAYNYDDAGFGPALDLLASGDLPLDALLEADDVPLDGLARALDRLAAGELAAKVLVRPEVDG
jgi:2-desacetyl-2-hydroxyethyl bacteriochlorophyllide A dehydrogenase